MAANHLIGQLFPLIGLGMSLHCHTLFLPSFSLSLYVSTSLPPSYPSLSLCLHFSPSFISLPLPCLCIHFSLLYIPPSLCISLNSSSVPSPFHLLNLFHSSLSSPPLSPNPSLLPSFSPALTLVLAPHLARSYHHLFPLPMFEEQEENRM